MSYALAAVAGGTALSIGGGILGRNDAMANAQAQAEARNAVLKDNIAKQQAFYNTNKSVWDQNIGGYSKPTQDALLQTSQDTRSNNNTGNQVAPDAASVPNSADASPAVKSELAKRMLTTFDQATQRAKSMGKLGGYGDAWQANQLANNDANRNIGVTNSFAEGRKALLAPEQDMAAAAAYKPPSIWGPILSGVGSIASAYGGSQLKGGGTFGGSSTLSPNTTSMLNLMPSDI